MPTRAKEIHAGGSLAGKVSIRLSAISSVVAVVWPGLFDFDGGVMSRVSSIRA
jgi:hypothetical protein